MSELESSKVRVAHRHPRYEACHDSGAARNRRQRGAVLVELAIVIVPLFLVVFTAIDFARMAKFQNRLTNAAREGAEVTQYFPGWVGPTSACTGNNPRNAIERATNQDEALRLNPGFQVRVRKVGGSAFLPGCRTTPAGVVPGDKLEVSVEARFATIAPFTKLLWGSEVLLKRSSIVVMQGAAP
ncbi:MAG: TadE family protein [Aquihabitans sp.]